VKSKAVSRPLHLGDQVAQFFDGIHLFIQEVSFEVVSQMRIVPLSDNGVKVEEGLVDFLLQLESCHNGLEGAAPLGRGWLGNVLENAFSASLVLIVHEHDGVASLLVAGFAEELGKSVQSLVIAGEVRGHGEVDVAGVHLHVDLLVDERLALLVVVLPDVGSHFVVSELLEPALELLG